MRIGITQPCFLPWPGYFWLISNVDEIVFLDNVQFDHRSWQHRNLIKLNEKKTFITIPVYQKNRSKEKINEKEVFYENKSINKIINRIQSAYKDTPYFEKYFDKFVNIFNKNEKYLLKLNLNLISFFMNEFNIKKKISFSSSLNLISKKEDLIFDICKIKKCNEYISTIGAKDYLNSKNFNNIKINYFFLDKERYEKNKFGSDIFSIVHYFFLYGPETMEKMNKFFKIEN